jgi:flavin-binding protein dodecin
MPIAKVIEVIAESEKDWTDAAQQAVDEAGKSVRGIRHLYVKEMKAEVVNGKITKYRLNANLTFVVE